MDMEPLLYWFIAVIPIAICIVSVLWVLGTWAAALENPGWFKWIALKEKYAAGIRDTIIAQVVMIVIAVFGLAYNFVQKHSLKDAYEQTASTLLCQVRGEATPSPILHGIQALGPLEGSYHRTALPSRGTYAKYSVRRNL